MRIKVLPIQRWMVDLDEDDQTRHMKPCEATYNKPGWYKVGTYSWFEDLKGRAFEYDVAAFDYMFSTLSAAELNHRHYEALKAIVEVKLATDAQRKLLYFYKHGQELRRIRNNTNACFLRIEKGDMLKKGETV